MRQEARVRALERELEAGRQERIQAEAAHADEHSLSSRRMQVQLESAERNCAEAQEEAQARDAIDYGEASIRLRLFCMCRGCSIPKQSNRNISTNSASCL